MRIGKDKRLNLIGNKRDRSLRVKELRLSFRWNGQHTVNVFRYAEGKRGASHEDINIDVFSIGDFATGKATADEFEQRVIEYLEDGRHKDALRMARDMGMINA